MRKGFDTLAPVYDALARIVFGKAMINSQTCFLDHLEKCEIVLVLGGGTGRWMNSVLETYPHLRITFIDASAEMIRIAKAKSEFKDRVLFIQGTQDSIPTEMKFDAVVLFYFVDLFESDSLSTVITKIKNNLRHDAKWLVADFVNSKWWHALLLKLMYVFFHIIAGLKTKTLPDWREILKQKNIREVEQKHFFGTFICSSVYQQQD